MRLFIGSTIGALLLGLVAFATPGLAGEQLTGTLERVVEEKFDVHDQEESHSHDHDRDHDHDAGEGVDPRHDADGSAVSFRERALLITDEDDVVELPLSAIGDLKTGTRIRVTLPRSRMDLPRVDVIAQPQPRSASRPVPTTQALPYAVVQVFTNAQDPATQFPATGADIQELFTSVVQPYFDREVPGAFDFSIHSTHTMTIDSTICGRERQTVLDAAEQFGIPRGVGVVLTIHESNSACSYTGKASAGSAEAGQWVLTTIPSGVNSTAGIVLLHELGHNLGLNHSRTWDCSSGAAYPEFSTQCRVEEYGSRWSIMGNDPDSVDSALDPHQRWELGSYGPGRMLSVSGGSGSAILLADTTAVSTTDNLVPTSEGGERILRALHLRDSVSETWLTYRVAPPQWRTDMPSGVAALVRAPWSTIGLTIPNDSDQPIQADVRYGAYGYDPPQVEAVRKDLFLPGSTVTTPGRIIVTVGEAVQTSLGAGMRVTWTNTITVPPTPPNPPALSVNGTSIASGATVAPGSAALTLKGISGDFAECSILTSSGASVVRWNAQEVQPVPGPDWWGRWSVRGFTAWAPTAQSTLTASWRYPLLGGVPADGLSAPVTLREGEYSWRTRCVGFDGQAVESSPTTISVVAPEPTPSPTDPGTPSPSPTDPGTPSPSPTDPGNPDPGDATAPRLSSGRLAILGLRTGVLNYAATSLKTLRPSVEVTVPGFADAESGLASRSGVCLDVPAGQSGQCLTPLAPGKGTIASGAVDRAGNASAVRVPYSLTLRKAVVKSSKKWSVMPFGAHPLERGAKVKLKVSGKQVGIIAAGGRDSGEIKVTLSNGFTRTVALSSVSAAIGLVTVIDLPPGKTTLTITYTRLSSILNLDKIYGIALLK